MNTRIVVTSLSIVSALLSGASSAQTQAPQVTLVTLPMPAGGSNLQLADIDAAGNVLGSVKIGTRYEVVEWLGGKTPVVLPRLAADQNEPNLDYMAVALNRTGGVLASAQQGDAQAFPGVYWDSGRHPVAVANSARVSGLSDTGLISGSIGILGPSETAARWTAPYTQPATLPYASTDICPTDCSNFGGPVSRSGKYIIGLMVPPVGNSNLLTSIYVNGALDSHFTGVGGLEVSQITDAEVFIGAQDTGIPSDHSNPNTYQATRWEAGFIQVSVRCRVPPLEPPLKASPTQ